MEFSSMRTVRSEVIRYPDQREWVFFPFLHSGAGKICSFTGFLRSTKYNDAMALDNRLLHFSSSNREAPSNHHFFFILFAESVQFHVLLIQMVGMIIGPPNIMQPILLVILLTYVRLSSIHSVTTKAKKKKHEKHVRRSDAAVPESLWRIFISSATPNKQV